MKLMIATPMYGGQCTGFYTQSLLLTQEALRQANIQFCFQFMYNESLIPRARNALVKSFLKGDCTHLLFIDADIRWKGEDIVHLINANVEIICGIYPKKEINWFSVEQAVKRGIDWDKLKNHTGAWVINLVNYDSEVTVPIDKPFEIWAGGTGMMLIKREVFEKMAEHVPAYRNDVTDLSGNLAQAEEISEFFATSIEPETQRLLSEDYHFCAIWRKLGGKVWAAPWMDLGHVGNYIFEGEFLKS